MRAALALACLLWLSLPAAAAAQDEDGQPTKLPPLARGVTLDLIRAGDGVFHGKGHCFACHGAEAEGLPDAGSALTQGLNFIPTEIAAIDSVIVYGLPEPVTRSAIAMPPRGGKSDLTTDEALAAAAYVWAISQVRGEPWPGGHRTHVGMVPAAALTGTASAGPLGTSTEPEPKRPGK